MGANVCGLLKNLMVRGDIVLWVTVVVGQWVKAFATQVEGWVFESQQWQT